MLSPQAPAHARQNTPSPEISPIGDISCPSLKMPTGSRKLAAMAEDPLTPYVPLVWIMSAYSTTFQKAEAAKAKAVARIGIEKVRQVTMADRLVRKAYDHEKRYPGCLSIAAVTGSATRLKKRYGFSKQYGSQLVIFVRSASRRFGMTTVQFAVRAKNRRLPPTLRDRFLASHEGVRLEEG